MIKLNDINLTFYIMYLIATVLGIIIAFIGISVYNKTDFFFLKSESMKFYSIFIIGFTMCSLVMNSAINVSGWNDLFVILSSLVGMALIITLILFTFNVQSMILNNKSNLIYFLISLIFLKVGLATIHRIVVLYA